MATECTTIEKVLKNIGKNEGIENCIIQIEPSLSKGENYLGLIIFVKLIGTNKELNLIVKKASDNDKLRDELPLLTVFRQEILIYQTIFPLMVKFQEEQGIFTKFNTAKCFYASKEIKNEFLVFENLKSNGFIMADRTKGLDENHVRLALETCAKFHAISIAMQQQNPQLFQEINQLVGEDLYQRIFIVPHKEAALKRFIKVIAEKGNKENANAFQRVFEEIPQIGNNMVNLNDHYNTLIHGDYWINNMMFKYEEEENPEQPTDMRVVDFQFCRMGSPIIDLIYIIYGSCTKEIWDKLDVILDFYHQCLIKHVKLLNISTDNVISRGTINEHWQRFSKLALILGSLFISLRTIKSEEVVDPLEVGEGEDFVSYFDKLDENALYNQLSIDFGNHIIENGFIELQ